MDRKVQLLQINLTGPAKTITTGSWDFAEMPPPEVVSAREAELALDSRFAKCGANSLHYRWHGAGNALRIDRAPEMLAALKKYPGGISEEYITQFHQPGFYGGLKFWVYAERPMPGAVLEIGFGKSFDRPFDYLFRVPLLFSGWRTVWIQLEDDAKVNLSACPDEVEVIEFRVAGADAGELWFDWFNFVQVVDPKRHSDLAARYRHPVPADENSWELLRHFEALQAHAIPPQVPDCGDDFADITRRLESLIIGSGEVANLPEPFRTVTFKILADAPAEAERLLKKRLFLFCDEHKSPEFAPISEFSLAAYALALDARLDPTEAKRELAVRFLEHVRREGFAAGSAMGDVFCMLFLNGFALAIFLMRAELARKERLGDFRELLLWFSMLGNALTVKPGEGINTDYVRALSLGKVIGALLETQVERRHAYLELAASFLSHAADYAPGYADTIKPDGSLYHHRSAFQNAYGSCTVLMLSELHWVLRGTRFAFAPRASAILRDTVLAQVNMAAKYDLHPGVCGRFPLNNHFLDGQFIVALAYLFDGSGDPELGGLLHYLSRQSDPVPLANAMRPGITWAGGIGMAELFRRNVEASRDFAETPARPGFHAFPYAAMAVHRRGEWMAAVRGWSAYIWDFEASQFDENVYGRYLGFGSLFLVTGKDDRGVTGFAGSLLDLAGDFDWSALPGATTKMLPPEVLRFDVIPDAKYLEGKHRNFSDRTLVGAVGLGLNGFYALDLHDTVAPDDDKSKFDDSFGAMKYYFFVDDRIFCFGDRIENGDSRYRTITTLFQNALPKGRECVLGHDGGDFMLADGEERRFASGVLRDLAGNHFAILAGDEVVLVRRGSRVTAYFDHGCAPKNGSYRYLAGIGHAPENDFEVIRQDGTATVVRSGGLTAIAALRPGSELKAPCPVNRVSAPVLMLAEMRGDKSFTLALTDPDLRLTRAGHNMSFMPDAVVQGAARPRPVMVELPGAWQLAAPVEDIKATVSPDGKRTMLTLLPREGLAVTMTLTQID
ncbi:MAG: chondroitinase family polysaccharide lyase [Victivallaceae bacterium]